MKKKSKIRNGYALALKKRCKGGKHKSKKIKRISGKNKQKEILNEIF